jgi:hypothetical protein
MSRRTSSERKAWVGLVGYTMICGEHGVSGDSQVGVSSCGVITTALMDVERNI